MRGIKSLLEKEEDYYKPVTVGNLYCKEYIKYESNVDRNKNLSIKEYFYATKLYLKSIINNLKKSDTWKNQ